MACIKRKGDVRKCVPIYAIGAVLIACGLPLMIAGIVGQFQGADVMGYVGGVSIFFGLGFLLLWHMFTIENVEKNIAPLDYDPNIRTINDIVLKSRAKELSATTGRSENTGFSNLAFVSDRSRDSSVSARTESQEMRGGDGKDEVVEGPEEIDRVTFISSSALESKNGTKSQGSEKEDEDSITSSSRNSIPVEVA